MCIKNDLDRCIGCKQCAKACENLRGGIIHPNPESSKPERMCTLCSGNPQCVENCPFGALSYVEMPADRELKGLSPQEIANRLMEKLYNINIQEG